MLELSPSAQQILAQFTFMSSNVVGFGLDCLLILTLSLPLYTFR